MSKVDLTVDLCGVKLSNPTMLASGILGASGGMYKRMLGEGVGAVITKSIGPEPRRGYPNPTVIEPMKNVILNAMGLPNPGQQKFLEDFKLIAPELNGVPLIVNIFGKEDEEFAQVAGAMEDAGVKILEINISCPHPEPKNGKRQLRLIGQDAEHTKRLVETIREAVKIPIIVKLSPNVTDIVDFARAAIDGGADAISAINTIQALEINPIVERPVLGNLVGGQSGPGIRCIAQRKIADICLAMRKEDLTKVPVIGIGGIASGLDAVRFMLLGAECVQIGSSIFYEDDYSIFKRINEEIESYMEDKGYKKLGDFRGKALKWLESGHSSPMQ